jgi:hypothetical protein
VIAKRLKQLILLVLLVWVSWPIVELFDHWDKPVDTGDDTQYSLIVLGLCAGTAYYIVSRRPQGFSLAEVARVVGRRLNSYPATVSAVGFLDWSSDSRDPPQSTVTSPTLRI